MHSRPKRSGVFSSFFTSLYLLSPIHRSSFNVQCSIPTLFTLFPLNLQEAHRSQLTAKKSLFLALFQKLISRFASIQPARKRWVGQDILDSVLQKCIAHRNFVFAKSLTKEQEKDVF